MTDEQPTNDRKLARYLALARTIGIRAAVGTLVFSMLIVWQVQEQGEPPSDLLLLLYVIGGAAAGSLVPSVIERDGDIAASRERVREAEQDVEAALGGAASMPRIQVGGDLHIAVPAQPNGETGHQQPAEGAASRQERRDLALSTLWRLTHRRLELYHRIATSHAKQSFISAQASMILGFGMLAAFVYLALKVSNTAGAIVAGGLGAVSAALAGFISKTFVKSQQTAAEHLRAYFDQPLEFSRYLAAERLLADANLSEEKQAEVVAALVQAIAAGPGGPAPADTGALLEQLQTLVPGQR